MPRFFPLIMLVFVLLSACEQVTAPDGISAEQLSILNSRLEEARQQGLFKLANPSGDNLLLNGDMEAGTTHWINCGGRIGVSNEAQAGNQALSITGPAGCIFQPMLSYSGQDLSLSCQAKSSDDSDWTGMGLSFSDSNWQPLSAEGVSLAGNSYGAYSLNSTAPANTAFVTFWLYRSGAGTVLLDSCSLSSNSAPPTPRGVIQGKFFEDANNNGRQDTGESDMANLGIELYKDNNSDGIANSGDELLSTKQSLPDGSFIFDSLSAGVYVMRVVLPRLIATYVRTTNTPVSIILAEGQTRSDIIFGYRNPNPTGEPPPVYVGDLQQITAPDAQLYDYFGTAVAIGTGVMVVGARGEDSKIGDGGAAYVYSWRNNAWRYDMTLYPSTPVMSGFFGSVVAISQNDGFIAVSGTGSGLYMFELVGGEWLERQLIPIQTSKFRFDQNRLITNGSPNSRIYERQNTGTWQLVASNLSAGYGVDISGNRAAVGSGTSVYLYDRNADGTWQQSASFNGIINTDPARPSARNIEQVLLVGDTLVLSTQAQETMWVNGLVAIHDFINGTWQHVKTLEQFKRFGASIDLDGDILAVGNPRGNTIFSFSRHLGGANAWGALGNFSYGQSDLGPGELGIGVAVRCNHVVGAAHLDISKGTSAGAVYAQNLSTVAACN
ncbi:MAG: hypothetical protein R2880_03225 [Deinococcales bacterium]